MMTRMGVADTILLAAHLTLQSRYCASRRSPEPDLLSRAEPLSCSRETLLGLFCHPPQHRSGSGKQISDHRVGTRAEKFLARLGNRTPLVHCLAIVQVLRDIASEDCIIKATQIGARA